MTEIPAPAVGVEDTRCVECKSSIVGVHHHLRGTFIYLCPVHFARLPEAERAAFDAIESNPVLPPCARTRMSPWLEVTVRSASGTFYRASDALSVHSGRHTS
jgi:hypothetical protein